MLDVCKRIFDEFMKQGVNYCHWKSNEHLAKGLNGETDLDLLVSDAHAKVMSDILRGCECIKVHPQFGSRYDDVEEWVGYDRKTGKLIHLHVHFRMITGTKYLKEYILPWHDAALTTKILNGNVYVMEPNLEFVILYMRIVLKEHRSIRDMERFVPPSEYRKEILWLKKQVDYEILSDLIGRIWREEKDDVLRVYCKEKLTKNDWARLQESAKNKTNVVRRGKYFGNHEVYVARRRLVSIKNLLKTKLGIAPFTTLKTLRRRGCVIVFIGCDGSGKSGMTKEIYKWLSWKLDCQRFYFGTGEGYKKPIIYKISRTPWLPDAVKELCSILFYYQVSLRCVCLRRLVDYYVSKGGIAVCDRYPQTQFRGIYDGPKICSLSPDEDTVLRNFFSTMERQNIAKVENKHIDLVFKLRLPTGTALKRSPGHAAGEVKRKAWITEKLQFPASDVYVIDATQPFEKELLEVKGIIWDKLIESRLS